MERQFDFKPDSEIFTETTEFEFDTLATRAREMAFLNRGLKSSLKISVKSREKQ